MELLEIALRLGAATLAGLAIGINRDLHDKPIGARTLGLVALGAACVALALVDHPEIAGNAEAFARVLQGIVQGIMVGIGFIGAGVILRDRAAGQVYGLTTAATVWLTAAFGVTAALARWHVLWIGFALAMLLLVGVRWLEQALERRAAKPIRHDKAD